MAVEQQARVYLDLVANGVEQASDQMKKLADRVVKGGESAARLRKELDSGMYAQAARAAAALSTEQANLNARMRQIDLVLERGRFGATMQNWTDRLQTVGRVGASAFGAITGTVGGFVRSGLQGSAELDRFNYAMQTISRNVANLFAPQIRAAVREVERLAEWFRRLDGEQQANLRSWIAWGAGLSGTLMILPKITSSLSAMALAARAVGVIRAPSVAAQVAGAGGAPGGGAAVGIASRLGPWGMAAAGLTALLGASNEGRAALAKLAAAISPLLNVVGKVASVLADVLGPAIVALSEGISAVVNTIADVVKWIGGVVGGVANTVRSQLDAMTADQIRAKMEETSSGVLRQFWSARLQETLAQQAAAPKKPRDELAFGGSNFEQVTDLYRRLSESGMKAPAEQAVDLGKQIKSILESMNSVFTRFGLSMPVVPPRREDA